MTTTTAPTEFVALSRLVQMKEIAAGFVFNAELQILARETPERYTDSALRQIAANMLSVIEKGKEASMPFSEFWIRFEHFLLWCKCFGSKQDHYLVIFAERAANVDELRQPLNLAALNLERIVTTVEEELAQKMAQTELALRAQAAERALFEDAGQDSNGFLASFGIIAERYFGPPHMDVLRFAARQSNLRLPIEKPEEMRQLAVSCAVMLKTPAKKESFQHQTEDMIQRFVLKTAAKNKKK